MALRTYAEVRPWAKAIKRNVAERKMPPWGAEPATGKYVNDPSLSDNEIATIVQWVDQGAVQGDPTNAPSPLRFDDEDWAIGEPDLTLAMDEEVVVPSEGDDRFPMFELPTGLTEDRWVKAVEIRPGDPEVVHHVMAYVDTSGTGETAWGDLMIEYAVGNRGDVFPEGTGRLLAAGSTVRFQVHYHSIGEERRDRTRIGFKLYPKGVTPKAVESHGIRNHNLYVPAGERNARSEAMFALHKPAEIISFQPHMHYRGKEMYLEALYPDGEREMLCAVPRFDFNWQITYTFKDPPVVPKGTKLRVLAVHDNSAANANNPDPAQDIWWGPNTTDEMNIGWTDVVYRDGE